MARKKMRHIFPSQSHSRTWAKRARGWSANQGQPSRGSVAVGVCPPTQSRSRTWDERTRGWSANRGQPIGGSGQEAGGGGRGSGNRGQPFRGSKAAGVCSRKRGSRTITETSRQWSANHILTSSLSSFQSSVLLGQAAKYY